MASNSTQGAFSPSSPLSADPGAPATPLGTLSSFSALYKVLARLAQLPSGRWRVEHSEDGAWTWTSLEAGHGGHSTPEEAIVAIEILLKAWASSRLEAEAAEVSHFFKSGNLERTKILVLDELNNSTIEVDGYRARSEDGKWHESTIAIEAITKAKDNRGRLR